MQYDPWQTSSILNLNGLSNKLSNITIISEATSADQSKSTLDDSGVMNIVTGSVFVFEGFVETFVVVDQFTSVNALKQVLAVLLMFSSVAAAGLLLCIFVKWKEQKNQNKKHIDKLSKVQHENSIPFEISSNKLLLLVTDYVDQLIPTVYHSKSLFSGLTGEFRLRHKYFSMIFTGSTDDIFFNVSQVVTSMFLLIFLVAVLFDTQGMYLQ
jgi:hypothetical protein